MTQDRQGIDEHGVISALGDLSPGSIVTEEGLACLFHRHPVSIKRAVQRGELPPPTRLFGGNAWTAGVLVRHIEARLAQAAREQEEATERTHNLEA